jgi:predicted nucleic acid-binding protein
VAKRGARATNRAFFDTSVLVAASVRAHPHHVPSVAVLSRIAPGAGACAAHTLAELYATLTALPLVPRVHPTDALAAVQHRAKTLTPVVLAKNDVLYAIAQAAAKHAVSGQIYDALILAAAEKSKADIVYTWNVEHFRRVASPNMEARIQPPPV